MAASDERRSAAIREVAKFSARLTALEQSVRILTKRFNSLDEHVVTLTTIFERLLDALKPCK